MKFLTKFALAFFVFLVSTTGHGAELRLAVTTSFNNSGLSDVLLPEIKRDLGVDVQLLVVGTGQALKLGQSGDVDAILVHAKSAEEKFIAEGYATHRREIMYNDFVIVGPSNDPAKIKGSDFATKALSAIRESGTYFVSRGDDSGTHKKELTLWQSSGLNPDSFSSDWYRSVGSGMGAALNTASGMNAYTLADRASWLKFANKGNLDLLFEGDPTLFNQYAYLPINTEKHPHVKAKLALQLENWLTGNNAQRIIGEYKIDGQSLFTPNATLN